ncbi:hypothetical protein Tco_0218641, partial [Tanacetum coccineum]
SFVPTLAFSEMVPFYINNLDFTLELRSISNFKTTGLLQPWQTLCKMFSRCLTTHVTGYDQPSLQIMQMLYCFINNIHVDYAELIWEGFHYSLKNPTTMLPYPRFTKLIVSHYMTAFPEISRRAHDRYHNLKGDVMIKSIFNSGMNKTVVGIRILDWMITEEMKLTENYRLYTKVFGVDVPTTQSQPTVSTQGMHRTTSALGYLPLLLLKENRVLNEDIVLQDTLQVSLAEQKSHDEDESRENVEQVKDHLMAEEIEKLVEGSENDAENVVEYVDENVEVISSPLRNDDIQNVPGTRLEPKSDNESPEVEITDVVPLINVNDEEEETTNDDYKIHSTLTSSDTEKLQELTVNNPTPSSYIPSSSSPSHNLSVANQLLSLFKAKHRCNKSFFQELQEIMMKALPKLVDERIKKILQTQVPLHVAQGLILEREKSQADVKKMISDAIQKERENLRLEISLQLNDVIANQIPSHVDLPSAFLPRDQDDPHDDAHPERENSVKRQKTYEHGMIKLRGSSSGQVYESKPGPSTLGDEHQYHIDQNPHAKIFYIKRQQEPGKPKEEIYSNLKIVQIIKTYWELGHDHKFVIEIVARRANGIIVDDYAKTGLLWSLSVFIGSTVIWERVLDFQLGVESYQQQVNITAPTITFPGIEEYEVFSIVSEPEGLKSYNNDVKHEYVTPSLSNEGGECLQLFEEEIEERLKHRDQIRHWEMYVNGRPLGPRRERPE